MNPLNNAGIYLINTLFDLYIFVWLVRLVLVAMRVHYVNPVSQIVIRLTQPIAIRLRRVLPNFRQIELASVVMVLALELLKYALLGILVVGMPNLVGLLIVAMADALIAIVHLFFYAIILQAIMSWFNPGYSPFGQILDSLTAPIMRPFHRLIPPMGGLDISPIFALMALQLVIIVFLSPLFALGWKAALG
jgi:YggT family protein